MGNQELAIMYGAGSGGLRADIIAVTHTHTDTHTDTHTHRHTHLSSVFHKVNSTFSKHHYFNFQYFNHKLNLVL